MLVYVVGIGTLLMAGIGAIHGTKWYLNLLLGAGGSLVLLGAGRPLYRSAVYRIDEQQVLCRFIPWYQANTLLTSVMLPIGGVAGIAMGREPDSPVWVGYAGYLLLALGIVLALLALFQSTNRLSFTPTCLIVRIGRRFEIPREQVVAVKPRTIASTGTGQITRHYDLVYVPAGGGNNRSMANLDMQFSVEPANLAAALQAWKDASPDDPGLMDRIEAILRGQHAT